MNISQWNVTSELNMTIFFLSVVMSSFCDVAMFVSIPAGRLICFDLCPTTPLKTGSIFSKLYLGQLTIALNLLLPSYRMLLYQSPWYNCTGWLGVKHQFTYLLTAASNVWGIFWWYRHRQMQKKSDWLETRLKVIASWLKVVKISFCPHH